MTCDTPSPSATCRLLLSGVSRIRAERRLGQLIAEQRETVGLATGGRPYQATGSATAPVETHRPTLSDIGVDKKLSSHSQKVAAIPEAEFEGIVAHALAIRARAEMRLAEEYDAAQDRGEAKRNGGDRTSVADRNTASAADLGLRRDEIHDWRKLRDAEAAEPGLVARALGRSERALGAGLTPL